MMRRYACVYVYVCMYECMYHVCMRVLDCSISQTYLRLIAHIRLAHGKSEAPQRSFQRIIACKQVKKTRCVTLVFAYTHACMHTCIYKLYIYIHTHTETHTHTQTQCLRQLPTNCPVLKAGFFSPMPCGTSWFHIGTGDVPGDLAKSAMAMSDCATCYRGFANLESCTAGRCAGKEYALWRDWVVGL